MQPDSVLAILWVIWLFSWALASGWTTKTRARQSGLDQLRHGVFIWMGAILFAHPGLLGPLLNRLYSRSPTATWIAVAVALVGFLWTWWARVHLGHLWSAAVTLKEGHEVVRSGPYRLTRHPIYSGLLLSIAATAFVRDSVAALAGVACFVTGFVLKIRQEEQLLRGTFGSTYTEYQRHVPALVPGVW